MQAKSQKQKKVNSILFIVAIILFGAVLVSSAFVAGTFAKYTTTGNGSDGATVAKWGITVDVESDSELFSESYSNADDSVVVFSTTNVIAPGTSNDDAVIFDISGTANDVDAQITITCTLTYGAGWSGTAAQTAGVSTYRPVTFTYAYGTGTATTITAGSNSILSNLIVESGTIPSVSDLTIAWAWPESTGSANDVLDTALGTLAAGGVEDMSITLTYTITIEQVTTDATPTA